MTRRIESPSAVSRLIRGHRRGKRLSQRELAHTISDNTSIQASRDQIARLESGRPLQFVPELLAGAVSALGIPIRTVGRALTRDLTSMLRELRWKP